LFDSFASQLTENCLEPYNLKCSQCKIEYIEEKKQMLLMVNKDDIPNDKNIHYCINTIETLLNKKNDYEIKIKSKNKIYEVLLTQKNGIIGYQPIF